MFTGEKCIFMAQRGTKQMHVIFFKTRSSLTHVIRSLAKLKLGLLAQVTASVKPQLYILIWWGGHSWQLILGEKGVSYSRVCILRCRIEGLPGCWTPVEGCGCTELKRASPAAECQGCSCLLHLGKTANQRKKDMNIQAKAPLPNPNGCFFRW